MCRPSQGVKTMSLAGTGLLLGAIVATAPNAFAQCTANELGKCNSADMSEGGAFGFAISLSGDVLAIGSPDDATNGSFSGAAFVHRFDGETWAEELKLLPADGDSSDQFGRAVAAYGDFIVVGAPNDEQAGNLSGSAYVFHYDGDSWNQQPKLLASDGAALDQFGFAVAADNDVIAIGAFGDASARGAVYVFRRNAGVWTQEQKLTASDGASGDRFGEAVAIQQDLIFVGAPREDDGASNAGSVYVFEFGESWLEIGELHPSNPSVNLSFGGSLSVDGNTLLVGATYSGGIDDGAAYVFRDSGSGWSQEAQLIPSDGAPGDEYGKSVSIAGEHAIVGQDAHEEIAGEFVGAAYVYWFDGIGWSQVAKLLASDAESGDAFGYAVTTDGSTIMVGAFIGPGIALNSGTVYLFTGLTDCNGNKTEDLCDIATGQSTDADGNGVPDSCECPWDLDGSSSVGITDLLGILAAWGSNPGGPPDFDGDGSVNIADLLATLGNWGPCS